MASPAELRPSEVDQRGEYLRGNGIVSIMSGNNAARTDCGYAFAPARSQRDKALGVDLPVAHHAVWNAAEPGRGQMVRARHAHHHTAGMVFTRDDREGHPAIFGDEDGRVWWSHDMQDWFSWKQVGEYLSNRPEDFVVEVLRLGRSSAHRSCPPDGACAMEELGHDAWL